MPYIKYDMHIRKQLHILRHYTSMPIRHYREYNDVKIRRLERDSNSHVLSL